MARSDPPEPFSLYLNQPPKQTVRLWRVGEGFARQLMTKQALQWNALAMDLLHPAAHAEKPRTNARPQRGVTGRAV